ncbi:MAG: hypothetical protein GF346_08730 [Candidatus Eisenbacteria bacterium]|nr:hypothetical protein [Candidatus Latescibacterota bacterium]MBD3302520.1 hypothetical protein [Candidatus Eisenbacteria bacterium]
MAEQTRPTRGGREGWGTWVGLAAVVLVPLLFYAGMIVGGKVPAAPDTLAVRPLGEWALETTDELGRTPLWNPYLFSGMPSYGSYIHTPASDLSPWKHIMAPFADARGMRYFLLMLLGGFSAFAFLRRQGASGPASAIAALGYVMTPYVPGVIEAGHSTKLAALMHVPLVLVALDWFLDRAGPWSTALLAGSTALLAWTNHPQILYYTVLIGVLYGLGRILLERGDWPVRRIGIAAAWLIGAVAVCFALIAEPTLAVREYAEHSIRGGGAEGGASWEYATGWSFHPKELVTFLFPEYYGLKSPTYFGPLPFTQSTHYIGIVFLLAAAAGLWMVRTRRNKIWGGIAAIVLLIGFGSELPVLYRPLFELLPYFNKFRVPSMIYAILPLVLAPLAAHGLDRLAQSSPPSERRKGKRRDRGSGGSRTRWLIAAGILAAAAVAFLLIGTLAKGNGPTGSGWFHPGELGRYPPEQLRELASVRWDLRFRGVAQGLLLLGVALAAVPVARRLPRPAGGLLLGGILMLDLLVIDAKFLSLEEPERIEATVAATPEIEFLQGQPQPFRILPIDEFGSNRFVAFDLATIGGYQPAKLRIYQDLIERDLLTRPPVLAMLNVGYLLSRRDPGHPLFESVAPGVYAYRAEQPRAWFVPSWVEQANDETLLARLGDPAFDASAVAHFVEGEGPDLPRRGLPVRDCDLVAHGPHAVEFSIGPGEGPGLLVVSEIYYEPGWRAAIDGEPAEILRADHVLRAVVVPEGAQRVEMRAVSETYDLGRSLNRAGGVALLLLVALGLIDRRRGRLRSDPPDGRA